MTEDKTFDRRVVLEPQEDEENDEVHAGLAVVRVEQGEDQPDALSFENFFWDEDGEAVPSRAALAPFPDGLKAIKELNALFEEWRDTEGDTK